jgi:tetratricopeptide (TPR) repeat protein
LRPLDEVAPARRNAVYAEGVFHAFGDTGRVVKAALTAAHMDFKIHDFDAALRRLLALSRDHWKELDDENRFALAANLGFAYRELGRFDEAIAAYERACACAGSRSNTESVRIRWNIATLLTRCGRLTDAVGELSRVRADFDRLEMRSESTVVGLEIAELLLIESRVPAAEALCRELCSRIEGAGLSSTSRAMTALGFLQEALSLRKATPKLVRQVRNYVERLPEEPNLLFAPPLL